MRDVVVIGGGLTGLSACYELEKLNLRYTVIELKRRFGGTIHSRRDRGFVMDAAGFAFSSLADEAWLPELGLSDQILPLDDGAFIFRAGAESLINALADKLGGGRLMRMAVSSLGHYQSRFTICLENGMMLDAGALILAAPARYAARMLYNLAPSAAERLAEHRCETTWTVALGIHKRDLPPSLPAAPFSFIRKTDHPSRVPDQDHCLIQLAMPAPAAAPPNDIIRAAAARLGLPAAPIAACATAAETPLSIDDHDHFASLRLIRALLPPGVNLAGSDFLPRPPAAPGLPQIAERLEAGRQAAKDARLFLKRRKSK